jgi:hypothetical protein
MAGSNGENQGAVLQNGELRSVPSRPDRDGSGSRVSRSSRGPAARALARSRDENREDWRVLPQRLQARCLGLRKAQTAAVCFIQRLGSGLDCTPQFHALVPEAVFVENADGSIERIARRTLAMLREEMSEEPQQDALDRLRIGAHQQQSFWALEEPPGQQAHRLSARCEGSRCRPAGICMRTTAKGSRY